MATESLQRRIETASCSVDGAAAFLMGLVQSPDLELSRQAHAMGDLLERISTDLDSIADEVAKLVKAEA